MGRPLHKKYFGNRNIGSTSTTADDGIGGQGVASVTVAGTNDNYSAFPTVSFAVPALPNGVQATGICVAGIHSLTVADAGTGYTVGDILTVVGGNGISATLSVTAITGGGATGPIDTVDIDFAGSYTALADLTDLAVTGGTGADAEITVNTLRINSITITEKGSGYTAAPAITDTPDGNATLTSVLTVDTGPVGSVTNQENAILITAWVPGTNDAGRISGNGTSAVVGDIVRQTGSDKYIVTTAQGTGRVTLQTTAADAAGKANIIATDYTGTTYYVTKVTAHKARITPYGAGTHEFPLVNGAAQVVPWTFDSLAAGDTGVRVRIDNA